MLKVETEQRAGYERGLFAHWSDADRDGCDTREEVLIRQSTVPVTLGPGCRVLAGQWASAYDGVVMQEASGLDIDHFVPLAEAWDSGARRWNAATREAFANDLTFGRSLIAVTAGSNRSKSDQDPATWLPTNQSYRCTYLTSWIAVKYRWSLTIDLAERGALSRLVRACGNPRLTLPPKATISGDGGGSGGSGGPDPRFGTCAAAKAAGFGPYVRGVDREYSWYRDGDRDGVVCE